MGVQRKGRGMGRHVNGEPGGREGEQCVGMGIKITGEGSWKANLGESRRNGKTWEGHLESTNQPRNKSNHRMVGKEWHK